MKESDFLVNG